MTGDIKQWLEGLGLGQYAQAFAENKIDLDVLTDLTDADLKDLDIPLGDRKRLLRGIDGLSDESAVSAGKSSESISPTSAPANGFRNDHG